MPFQLLSHVINFLSYDFKAILKCIFVFLLCVLSLRMYNNCVISQRPLAIEWMPLGRAPTIRVVDNTWEGNKITDFVKCAGNTKPNWKQISGVWIDLHPIQIDQFVSGTIWRGGIWKNSKYTFLKKNMKKDTVFVDIGANIGTFTLRALKDGYHVIAVEAFAKNIQKLCSSIVKNNFTDVELYQNALWDDVEGTLGFNTPTDNIGGNMVSLNKSGEQVHKIQMETIVAPLYEYVMKIDIEAAECRAFRSAAVWDNPPLALTMEWGNLKNNRNLCPQKMYNALVHNITKSYGQNLQNYTELDAPNLLRSMVKLWDKKDGSEYDDVATLIQSLHDAGIDSFLYGGSGIGAYRNHGWIVGDRDADLLVMSTNLTKIESVLRSSKFNFNVNTDGKGLPRNSGFGYHVNIRNSKYVDLWLFKDVADEKIQCIGYKRGCHRWCNKYIKKECNKLPKSWIYPVRHVPFGPYLMPSIHEDYLDFLYSKTWKYMCGGCVYFETNCKNCSDLYGNQTFVFWSKDEQGNKVATAKKGNKVENEFVVKNDTYTLRHVV